jgi:hypothetical protein
MRNLLIFVSVLLGLSAPAVAGEIIANYGQDMSFLPARIEALHFASGPMDQKHAIAWGYWTVRFGDATPVATPFRGQGQVTSFEIPLQCENNELGARECTIEIDETTLNVPVCRISDGERINMQVACPKSIELAR